MNALIYYSLLPFIYLVSIQPFFILYRISDFLYVLVYYVFGYRKKVVITNLRNAFPNKTETEIHALARKFYSYFCDFLVESLKSITISKKEILKRCHYENSDMASNYFRENKSVLCVLGHYGNWEWAAPSVSLVQPLQLFVVYNPLSNKYFDNLMYKIRSRYGTKLIAMQNIAKEMFKNRLTTSATIFVADQTPPPHNAYWMTFLNQDTPVLRGTEVLAKKFNLPVVFIHVTRKKRGFYIVKSEVLTDSPLETQEGEITELHTKKLEEEILRQPELWLWSHKRWKHKRNLQI